MHTTLSDYSRWYANYCRAHVVAKSSINFIIPNFGTKIRRKEISHLVNEEGFRTENILCPMAEMRWELIQSAQSLINNSLQILSLASPLCFGRGVWHDISSLRILICSGGGDERGYGMSIKGVGCRFHPVYDDRKPEIELL